MKKWAKPTVTAYRGTVMVMDRIMSAKTAAKLLKLMKGLGRELPSARLLPSVFDPDSR